MPDDRAWIAHHETHGAAGTFTYALAVVRLLLITGDDEEIEALVAAAPCAACLVTAVGHIGLEIGAEVFPGGGKRPDGRNFTADYMRAAARVINGYADGLRAQN